MKGTRRAVFCAASAGWFGVLFTRHWGKECVFYCCSLPRSCDGPPGPDVLILLPAIIGEPSCCCCCCCWLIMDRIRLWADWTAKKLPMMCTVVSSPVEAPCSGNLITEEVVRCISRTFWPPLPMILPTWLDGTNSSIVNRTSSPAGMNPSSRIFSKMRYWALNVFIKEGGKLS